jgi:hypothetical protein
LILYNYGGICSTVHTGKFAAYSMLEVKTMERHREIKIPKEPFIDWERKRYTGSKVGLSAADQAELETDRDLGKPVEQLLCDVYEGYTYWLKLQDSPDTPQEMKKPIELILYTMVRTASMNAVLAKENTALQKSIKILTRWLWILTIILVLFGAVQIGLQICSPNLYNETSNKAIHSELVPPSAPQVR